MKNNNFLVSVVTPSYNMATFIEQTILSIKNQTYPLVEHLVIDGLSSDNTLDILKKYEGSYNMRWVSEPDTGQSDAINKGWKQAHGEILAYLNTDDIYMPQAIEIAVNYFDNHPDVSMVYGDTNLINEHDEQIGKYPVTEFDLSDMLCGRNMICQPSVFFRREVLDKIGYLDTNLHLVMDLDFWIRISLELKVKYTSQPLASMRYWPGTKSENAGYKSSHEYLYILNKLFSNYKLPKKVKVLRRRAYSCIYLKVGLNYHSQHQIKQTWRYFLKSFMSSPGPLLNWLAGYLAISLLGKRVTNILIKWNHH